MIRAFIHSADILTADLPKIRNLADQRKINFNPALTNQLTFCLISII